MQKDINLIYEMGCLRFVQRTWRHFFNADFANVAEHTLRVAWIAMILAKHEKDVDMNKLIKMVLVHDITESRTGDVNYLSRQYCERREEKAIYDMLHGTVLEEFIDLWHECEKKESIEAKIVKDADNLDVDFELQEQKARGMTIIESKKEMREHVAKNKLYTETARKIWQDLQNSDPHAWHRTANNRFQEGDWKR